MIHLPGKIFIKEVAEVITADLGDAFARGSGQNSSIGVVEGIIVKPLSSR